MAAYGSLVSLMHIIDQLQHHPSPPISLDKLQLQSLTQTITFLQEFLEGYSSQFADSEEADPLEIRIVKAAYEAEDVIESYIVANIKLAASESHDEKAAYEADEDVIESSDEDVIESSDEDVIESYIVANIKLAASKIHDEQISCINFYEDLQRVIEEMDVIKKVAMEIPTEKAAAIQDLQQLRKPNVPASVGLNNHTMVGFDEVLHEILDKLTTGGVDRQVIPIVGMGGIGKTTLARNLYAQPLVKERFDICVWVTISQQFNPKQILCEVLSQANKESRENMDKKTEDEVQTAVHQYLWHRRFLIVMDDMWSIDPWNKIQPFFPDDNNGSRILVTTRLSALGSQLDNSSVTQMRFLDEDSSWALFSQTVFGEESFPLDLVEIGKKIVESCKGLPLTIAVIGGLLKKLQHTQECWESIGKNLNSAVSLESDEYCLKILKMSYNHLPAHLKPCFLYMGVFEEDREIRVSELVRLWISEGFVKAISGKSLETSAEEYLKDLVGRNLLVAHKLKYDGNIKYCKIHDLLREVCLREAQKENFYHVIEPHSYPAMYRERCIVIPKNITEEKLVSALQSIPHARSLISCHNRRVRLKPNCGLLRSLLALDVFRRPLPFHNECVVDVFELVNLRYLAVEVDNDSKFFSSINLLWNLHTLIVTNALYSEPVPPDIWKMSQLRHVYFNSGLRLPDPPRGNNDIVIMENLQTLQGVWSFKCSEEVVKRIPNIKKLHISCDDDDDDDDDDFCLNNLSSLHKLEYFDCCCVTRNGDHLNNLTFPQSLQKLTLFSNEGFDCDNALEKIGSLPLLRKLILTCGNFKRRKWETVEGEFRSLRFLQLALCRGLRVWEMADCSHFPRLEHLLLYQLVQLEEIPWEIGEIATLKSVKLWRCSESSVKSMKKIVEEQEDLQGEEELGFHVRVILWKENEAVQSLASPNFEVTIG